MKKILLILVLFLFIYEAKAQIAVIANKSVNLEKIDVMKAQGLFTLSAKGYKVFYLKSGNISNPFFLKIGSNFDFIQKIWLKAQLTEGKFAVGMNSDEDMLQKVSSVSGAIGYIPKDKVNQSVKVLLVVQ